MSIHLASTGHAHRFVSGRARRVLIAALTFVLFIVVAYCAFCFYAASQLAASSRRSPTSTPADYGAAYQEVSFKSAVDGIPLSGWYVGPGGRKVILVMHARDGVRDDHIVGLNEITATLVRNGYDVLAFDFRGHGLSGGQVAGFGKIETRDIAGALDYLKGRGINQVGAYGCSLGGDTALLSAPDQPAIRAIVADSALADAGPIIENGFVKQTGLPSFMLPGILLAAGQMYGLDWSNTRPADAVARVGDRPILLIHGASDSWTPLSGMYVIQKAGEKDSNLQSWVVPGAEHCRAYSQNPQEYMQRVLAFFNRYF